MLQQWLNLEEYFSKVFSTQYSKSSLRTVNITERRIYSGIVNETGTGVKKSLLKMRDMRWNYTKT